MTEYCPQCGTELVEGKPDCKGKPWFYCNDCECFFHADNLAEAKNAVENLQDAQHAVDVMASFDGPLPELTGALSLEHYCEQRLKEITTQFVAQPARQ